MKQLDEVTAYLARHKFTPHLRSGDGSSITYSNSDCNVCIDFVMKSDGYGGIPALHFRVFGMLPASMVIVKTDYIYFDNRVEFLWKCVTEAHNAIKQYKLALNKGLF